MQSSFGEGDITIGNLHVGKFRVLDVVAAPAIYPRLGIKLGCSLHDNPKHEFGTDRPVEAFEVRDLSGELRLSEHADTVGTLLWAGSHRHVRSSGYGQENELNTVCDLDAGRIERLEQHRDGGEQVLWVVLWATMHDQKGFLDSKVQPFRIQIPRDRWLSVIEQIRKQRISIVEVAFSEAEDARFQRAADHLREAHNRVDRGDYSEAVACCRRVLESLTSQLDIENTTDAVRQFLETRTDPRLAEQYAGLVTRIKNLANLAVHHTGEPVEYSRTGARFVVGITEQFAVLVASLSQ